MRPVLLDPERWSTARPGAGAGAGRAAADLRVLRQSPPAGEESLARIWSRIEVRQEGSEASVRLWRPAVLVAALLGASGVVAAATGALPFRERWRSSVADVPAVGSKVRDHRPPKLAPDPGAPPLPLAPIIEPLPAPAAAPEPARAVAVMDSPGRAAARYVAPRRREVVAPAPPPVQPAAVAVVEPPPLRPATPIDRDLLEAQAVGAALRKLRQDKDPGGALVLLDGWESRFPRGPLAQEVTLTRVEALLALGRREDALAALRTLEIRGAPLSRELHVVRGELRAQGVDGGCLAALADFGAGLSPRPGDLLDQRALRGRAACRARTGDAAGARDDLRQYLARFPTGRFAAEARAALGGP